VKKERDRLTSLLEAIQLQKARGLSGSSVVGAYHARGVAPIMAQTLPLYRMAPGVDLSGTVLAREAMRPSEIQQWLQEAFEGPLLPHPDPQQSKMLPKAGAVAVVRAFLPPDLAFLLVLFLVVDFPLPFDF